MLVSVLMPTYNRANLIGESIQSVLDQTYQDFELIIIDDGSNDDTKQVVMDFSDSRIRYLEIQHTGIVSKVRNLAISEANGNFIAFLDSDDLWIPQHLYSLMEIFKKQPDLGMAFSNVQEFSKNKIIRAKLYDRELENRLIGPLNILPLILHSEIAIYPTSMMFSKNCIDSTGFMDENISITETNFIGRAAKNFKAQYSQMTTVRVRKHNHNHSDQNRDTAFMELFLLLKELKNSDDISNTDYQKLAFKYHYRFGIERLECKDYEAAKSAFAKAISLKPWSVKSILKWTRIIIHS